LEEDDNDDDEAAEVPPKLLSLFVSALQISLDSSYTAPRLSQPPPSAYSSSTATPGQSEASTSSNFLIPSTHEKDAAYQSISLQRHSNNNGEVTQMFSSSWNGSRIPDEKPQQSIAKVPKMAKKSSSADEEEELKNGGEIWYAEERGEGKWVVEWRCKLPIGEFDVSRIFACLPMRLTLFLSTLSLVFMRTRHPTPALLLTATMGLRLQPSHLSRLDPSLAISSSTSASESLYLHDLLNPLSEGPAYPDESPAERAARANASLAKLPLGKLPSTILGSKLVTPARNAREVGEIVAIKTRTNAVENGDVGDTNKDSRANARRAAGRRVLTNQGLMAFQLGVEGNVSSLSDDHAKGLGEQVVTMQRSARRVVDVHSAVVVRMRTITVPGFQGEGEDAQSALLHSLILCVEVENPVNSGVKFALEEVDVHVSMPLSSPSSSSSGAGEYDNPIEVSMCRIGECSEPMLIEQGSQSNLLYRMVFHYSASQDVSNKDTMKSLSLSHRTISIRLLGRPVLLQSVNGEIESYTPTRLFTSTWTCTLDFIAQMRMIVLEGVIRNGAGGDRLGGDATQGMNGRLANRISSTSAPYTNGSGPPLPPSPYSPLPRTPVEMRLASTATMTRIQSVRPSLSLGRPSLRMSSALHTGQSFVSLQRSLSDQQESFSPALPSALVGQSILARARMNRSSSMMSGGVGEEDSRSLLNGNEMESKSRSASERTVTPMQRRSFHHLQRSLEGSNLEDDLARDSLLPLADKRSTPTIQRLLYDPSHEQGLLIDVVTLSSADQKNDGKKKVSVEIQVENRSQSARVVILSWKIPPAQAVGSIWNSILLEDDDVQVGPLQQGDSEIVTLNICISKAGVHQLPPLAVYDTSTGMEKVLQGLQSVMV
jgi:hypothetical protein